MIMLNFSSSEGTFEYNAYCKSSSSSHSGSDVGGIGCDSNFGNNGSLESIEDSVSATSAGSDHEFEPLRPVHVGVGVGIGDFEPLRPTHGIGGDRDFEPLRPTHRAVPL